MTIKTSKEALDFVRGLLKSRPVHGVKESNTSQSVASAAKEVDPLEKYSIDYSKWDHLERELVRESEEEKKKAEEAQRAVIGGCAHDHSDERQIYEKPTVEKLRAAERFREEGNKAFKEKNLQLAVVFYRKALLQFDYTFPDTPEENAWFDREKLACHLNMALCKIQQKDWEEALTQCRLALKIDPENCKAFYRRGLVHLKLDNFSKAEAALKEARRLQPSDSLITEALSELEKKRQKYKLKKQKMFATMLRPSTDL